MLRNFSLVVSILCLLITAAVAQRAETGAFVPVTDQMLANPSPDDWLMFSQLAFSHEMATGTQESIPIVYRGRIYIVHPGSVIQAIDGTNGKLIWEYKRPSGITRISRI